MVRRRENVGTYFIETNKLYAVTLKRLENNYYGNPRYEATIITLSNLGGVGYDPSIVYRFTGHYTGDQAEAEWIVNYHEKHK